MKTYLINGFIIPVTEQENNTVRELFDNVVEADDNNSYTTQQKYSKYLYELYKKAMINGKAKRVDGHYVIRENDGVYTYHNITHKPLF